MPGPTHLLCLRTQLHRWAPCERLSLLQVSTYDGASDLVGQMSAAFTSAALLFENSDPAYYAQLMNASYLLYAAGEAAPGRLQCSNMPEHKRP